ncbi:MAG: LuxR C-terminal-related transcriptional regulator [Parvibaculum sp.]
MTQEKIDRKRLRRGAAGEFAENTLAYLEKLVGTTSSCFYLVDAAGNAHSHILRNLNYELFPDYLSTYYKLDPLHPRRLLAYGQRVISLNQVIHPSSLVHSTYFRNFLQPNGIANETEILFRRNDEIVAGISLHVNDPDKNFGQKEIDLLKDFSGYAEQVYLNCFFEAANENRVVARSDLNALSRRERQIVMLLASGKSNSGIAQAANISVSTVKTHVYNIFKKTGTKTRTELVSRFYADSETVAWS